MTQTSKDIARVTVLMRRGDKQAKLQIEKLTSDFKDAVQRYSEMQRVSITFYVLHSYLSVMKFIMYSRSA